MTTTLTDEELAWLDERAVGTDSFCLTLAGRAAGEIRAARALIADLTATVERLTAEVGQMKMSIALCSGSCHYDSELSEAERTYPTAPAPLTVKAGAMTRCIRLGDHVTWTTAGITRTGYVAEVVAAGESPTGITAPGIRDHEAYVIDVAGRRYWPHVQHLRPVEAGR